MASLMPQDVLDLTVSTRNHYWKEDLVDLLVGDGRQRCVAASAFFDKNRIAVEGGTQIEQRIDPFDPGTFNETGLYGVDVANQDSGLASGTIPWVMGNKAYIWDRREESINSGAEQILDLMKIRRRRCLTGFWLGLENRLFGSPASSSVTNQMFGLGSYLVVGTNPATPPDGDFTGANPSGWTSGIGFNSTTYGEKWANYYGTYDDFSYNQVGVALQQAMYRTGFMSPIGDSIQDAKQSNYSIFINFATEVELKKILRAQNQNLGFDLDAADGRLVFQGRKFTVASILDSSTQWGTSTNPILGVNHDYLKVVVKTGFYFTESEIIPGDQHNVVRFWFDLVWNLRCTNRRANFLLCQV